MRKIRTTSRRLMNPAQRRWYSTRRACLLSFPSGAGDQLGEPGQLVGGELRRGIGQMRGERLFEGVAEVNLKDAPEGRTPGAVARFSRAVDVLFPVAAKREMSFVAEDTEE